MIQNETFRFHDIHLLLNKDLQDKLLNKSNKCIHFCLGLPQKMHIGSLHSGKMNWLSVKEKKKSFIASMVFKYLNVIAPAWIKCLALTNYLRLQGPDDTGNISEKNKCNTKQKFLGWKYDRKQSLTLEISEGATDRCSSEKNVLESVAKCTGQHMLWVVAYLRRCVGCGHVWYPSPNIKCPLLQSFFMTSYSNNLKTYSILLRVA